MPIKKRVDEASSLNGFIPEFYRKSPTLPEHAQRGFGPVPRGSLLRRHTRTSQHRQVAPDKMQRFPGSLGLLLDAVQYPGPDGAVVGNILRFLGIFEAKKLKNGAIRNAFGNFFCARFSRNNARSSSYDLHSSGVFADSLQFLMPFLRRSGTLGTWCRRVSCSESQQTPRLDSSWLLYNVYLYASKPRNKSAS